MVTRSWMAPATRFLPFNQGNDGGAGNPVNASGGHGTAYLWESIWARESWLEILGKYLVAQKDKKKQISKIIFPRFHQLDATRKLREAVLKDGAGKKYLVQHSAGSGKTNSIAWTARFLADLHDAHRTGRCLIRCWWCRIGMSSTHSCRRRFSISSGLAAWWRRSKGRVTARAGNWRRRLVGG